MDGGEVGDHYPVETELAGGGVVDDGDPAITAPGAGELRIGDGDHFEVEPLGGQPVREDVLAEIDEEDAGEVVLGLGAREAGVGFFDADEALEGVAVDGTPVVGTHDSPQA